MPPLLATIKSSPAIFSKFREGISKTEKVFHHSGWGQHHRSKNQGPHSEWICLSSMESSCTQIRFLMSHCDVITFTTWHLITGFIWGRRKQVQKLALKKQQLETVSVLLPKWKQANILQHPKYNASLNRCCTSYSSLISFCHCSLSQSLHFPQIWQ